MLLREQGPGGVTASFGGSIDVDLSHESVRFIGGEVRPGEPASWEPGPFGVPGFAPASYGLLAGVNSPSLTVVGRAASRHLVLDAASPALPLVAGEFPARQLDLPILEDGGSVVDYHFFFRFVITDPDFTLARYGAGFRLGDGTEVEDAIESPSSGGGSGTAEVTVTIAGRHVLSGALDNRATGAGRIGANGGVTTLTVPIDARYTFTAVSDSGDQLRFDLVFTGQLVGAAITPSPTPSATATSFAAMTPTATSTPDGAKLVGDCGGDGRVTVDELIKSVSIALGMLALEACPSSDRDGDGRPGIDELLQAVNLSLAART
jgi:hypothetical protein